MYTFGGIYVWVFYTKFCAKWWSIWICKEKAFSDYENEEEIKSNVHYPDKEKIHQKMLDSIDYFKNISGQFEEYSSSSRIATTYKYAIDTEKQRGISSKEDKLAKTNNYI